MGPQTPAGDGNMTQLSQVGGGADVPLLEMTIGQALEAAVARWPDREALVVRHQDIRWTYAELLRQVDAFAAGLIALGLEPGDRIGVWAPNSMEWVVTQFAAARAGLVLVNINPAYRLAELDYALNKVGCRALVTADRFKSSDYVAMLRELAPEIKSSMPGQLRSTRFPALRVVILAGEAQEPGFLPFGEAASWAGAAERARIAEVSAKVKPNDAANIQFTSGTTGAPKGATLSHRNILNNGYFVGRAIRMSEADRICIPVPLYHCFGMGMGNLACITHGACMVYPSGGFDPGATLQAVAAERCTALYGVPTMFIAILAHTDFEGFDLKSLRTGIMAGSPCPVEVMKRCVAEMNMSEVTIAYGMTETSPVSMQTSADDPFERRVGSVGRVHPHVEVKIVDADGAVVPRGVTGELCTRGYSVMLGYWDEAEKTAEVLDADGWMHTGDLATIDDDGYANIVGRIKDMVIRGGENIYPAEIEDYLFRHPKVAAVQVVGVPDPRFVEELCAWIQLKPGETASEEDIRDFCRGQIAHYKVPRYVRFVDAFPLTVTGKVQKFLIRKAMIEELGLNEAVTA